MHIAVCDDNVADRKQTERLLDRESVKRIPTTGNLYVDSYGHVESLISAPQKYDLFFIDMTDLPPHGMEVAIQLREMGVTAPIVMMVSTINYRNYVQVPEDIWFLDKPVKKAELSDIIDKGLERFSQKKPTIELRDETKAYYVLPDQLVYATPDAHIMRVKLSDGSLINQLGTLEDLCRALENFDCFYILNRKYVININHVLYVKKRILTMSDGTKLKAGLTEGKSILNLVNAHGSRFIPENLADKYRQEHNDTSDPLT